MKAVLVLAVVVVGLGATLFSSYAGLPLYSWFAFFRPQEWTWGVLASLRSEPCVGDRLRTRRARWELFPTFS